MVNADVVLRDAKGRKGPFTPMTPGAPGTDRWSARGHADQRGPLDLRGRGVERPGRHLAPRRDHQDRGRRRRRADARGGRPGARAGGRASRPASGRRALLDAATALRDTSRPVPGPARRGRRPRGARRRCAEQPLRDFVTSQRPDAAVGRPRAGALRQLVRVLPAVRGRRDGQRTACCAPAPSGPPRSGCPRSRRWASTSSTCRRSTRSARTNRKGPNNTLTPGPDDVGSPWAIGSPEGGHDAIHPDLGTEKDFDAFVAKTTDLGHGGRARPRAAGHPGPPVGDGAPGVVHRARRRHDRVRREPAQEVPGHLPGQLRPRPRGHLRRGAAGRAEVDGPRRADLPGRQPAHQAGRASGSGCSARSARPTRTCSSSPRRSPGRR